MNISYKQSQFELFPKDGQQPNKDKSPRMSIGQLSLSIENLVILGIVAIMLMLFSFSLGVERGKLILLENREDEDVAEVAMDSSQVSDTTLAFEPVTIQTEQVEEAVQAEIVPEPVQIALEEISYPNYTIQVASFKRSEHAEEEAEALREKGFEVFVLPKGDYKIVCVGKFQERDQAKVFSAKIKDRYKDYLVRRL